MEIIHGCVDFIHLMKVNHFGKNADQSLSFLQINEEQFTKFKYNYTYFLDNGNLTFVEIPVNDPPKSFDKKYNKTSIK
jgi:hypothetical protein